MVPGIICGVLGILFLGCGRACYILCLSGSDLDMQQASHGFVMMTLVFGTTMSGVSALFFETIQTIWPPSNTATGMMVLNLVALIGATISGTSVIAYSGLSFNGKIYTTNHTAGLIASIGSTFLVVILAMFSSQIPYVTPIQIAAYLTANICLVGLNEIYVFILTCLDKKFQPKNAAHHQRRQLSQFFTNIPIAIICTAVCYILTFASSAAIDALPLGLPTTYDLSFKSPSRFDIVVSMYTEDPASVKQMLNQIKTTTLVKSLYDQSQSPQVIIYTKNPAADLQALKQSTGADIVERLDNVGREGGTYLSHITDKWDSLAEQTMFIQAHAHNSRELIPRINDYLVQNTGMLSLGFTGVACSCGSCNDRWGWSDKDSIIPTTYENIYGMACDPSQHILLSYKGQFVASARRIRGIKREVYDNLLKSVTNSEDGANTGGTTGVDSPSNPFFGFTMERIWSLVMQCATNEKIMTKCPSLLSGMGIGGRVEDCQCLDETN
jgi:hypothetical protein